MKNIKFLFAAILVSLFLTRCDYVHPLKQAGAVGPVGTICTSISDSTTTRQVLVEDYTGHRCGNCPFAAYHLDTLMNAPNGNRIVPIAVHAGYFADTAGAGFVPLYTTNFNTTAGTIWDTQFNMSGQGNPSGMIDREGYPVSNWQTYTAWDALISNTLSVPNAMNIKITNYYSCSSRIDSSIITANYLQAMDSIYMLSVVITEDSIINNQEIYVNHDPGNTQNIPNYQFDHLLRGSLNGAWGDTLSIGAQPINSNFTKTYKLDLNSLPVLSDKHCSIVAFIYNAATYQVVQAIRARVTQ